MDIKTHEITLTIETSLSPAGLHHLAAHLAELGDTSPSVTHGATFCSMSDAFVCAAHRAEGAEAFAEGRETNASYAYLESASLLTGPARASWRLGWARAELASS